MASFVAISQNEKKMKTEHEDKINIVGISIRTTNENGQSAIDIENLWGRFWSEDIQKQIPNKTSDEIYAIYTDYESDFEGAYTTIIGLPVSSLDQIPRGFVGFTIKGGRYKKYVSKGKMPEAVYSTWVEIWNDMNLKRAYQTDFTVHGEKYYDGDNAEVETFISIQE